MKTHHTYADGQPVMMWDLVVYLDALHVVDAIHSKDEPWVIDGEYGDDLIMLAGVDSAFGVVQPRNDEHLELLCRCDELEAQGILYAHPKCGGANRIEVPKAVALMNRKGIGFQSRWLEPKYHVSGGGPIP